MRTANEVIDERLQDLITSRLCDQLDAQRACQIGPRLGYRFKDQFVAQLWVPLRRRLWVPLLAVIFSEGIPDEER